MDVLVKLYPFTMRMMPNVWLRNVWAAKFVFSKLRIVLSRHK